MNYGTLAIMKKFIPLMLHFHWPRSPWSTLFIKKILTNGCFKNYTAIVIWRCALSNWSQRKMKPLQNEAITKWQRFFLSFSYSYLVRIQTIFFSLVSFTHIQAKNTVITVFQSVLAVFRLGQYADLGQYFPVQNGKKVIILLIFIYVTSKKRLLSHLYCRGWQS